MMLLRPRSECVFLISELWCVFVHENSLMRHALELNMNSAVGGGKPVRPEIFNTESWTFLFFIYHCAID